MRAAEIFKTIDSQYGKPYDRQQERVLKVGKVNNEFAYRIIEKTKYIYNSPVFTVEVASVDKPLHFKSFDTIKDVNEFIESLK